MRGTGYASLSYPRVLMIDKLKIERALVRHLHTDGPEQSATTLRVSRHAYGFHLGRGSGFPASTCWR